MARARTGGNSSAAWAITALAAGFGVCLVLAIVLFAQSGGAQEQLNAAQNDLAIFVTPGEAQLPVVAEARSTAASTRGSVVGVLLQRINESEQSAGVAADQLAQTRTELEGLQTRFDQQAARAEAADARAAAAAAERDRLRGVYDQQVAALKADVDRAGSVNEQLQASLNSMQASLTGTLTENRNDLQARIDAAQLELASSRRELDEAVAALERATERQSERAARVAVPDARIVSLLDNGTAAFLDIGSNQRVSLGMTFGVFSGSTLVKLGGSGGDTEEVPPKAVLEVYEVAPGTATARLVQLRANSRLSVGDAVVNVAFDPQRELKFHVFGAFDVNGDGLDTEGEAERIKSMIERFGATVTDNLDFDVDFLVLGAPPELPQELVGNQLTDAVRIREFNAALEKFNATTELLTLAERYTIPVLNQSRFLDLIGFYNR